MINSPDIPRYTIAQSVESAKITLQGTPQHPTGTEIEAFLYVIVAIVKRILVEEVDPS
jgi:hypothetical protein